VKRSSKGPTIHEALESPDLEEVIAEAAAHAQAGDLCGSLRGWPRWYQVHETAADRELSPFPEGLVDQQLLAGDDGVAHRPDAVAVVELTGSLQILDLLLKRWWRNQAFDQVHCRRAQQYSGGSAISGALNRPMWGVRCRAGDAGE